VTVVLHLKYLPGPAGRWDVRGRGLLPLGWDAGATWSVAVAVPLTFGASKNRVWRHTKGGRVYMTDEARAFKKRLTGELSLSLAPVAALVRRNKVWLHILVRKDSWRGDAINLLDLTADCLRDALGGAVDDNYFCVSRLDWDTGPEPLLALGAYQTEGVDARVCPGCKRFLTDNFFARRHKGLATGHCRLCEGKEK
jgi:hypothetical protein